MRVFGLEMQSRSEHFLNSIITALLEILSMCIIISITVCTCLEVSQLKGNKLLKALLIELRRTNWLSATHLILFAHPKFCAKCMQTKKHSRPLKLI